jgi:hypothetical protein
LHCAVQEGRLDVVAREADDGEALIPGQGLFPG